MVELASYPPDSSAAAQARTGRASRVIFVDIARSLAVLFMLYGHAMSALLAPEYQAGTWFEVWRFQRGLTSVLFLLLSGCAFSIATSRRWASHLTPSRALARRVARFVFYILLGYWLHFPVGSLLALSTATAPQWQAFLAVDVLQLIGATFLAVQALVFVTRSRALFTAAALVLAAFIIVATPAVWRTDWPAYVPLWASSFLSPATGSLFPLFPSAAYVLLGAALGHAYVEWGAERPRAYANTLLLGTGGLLIATGLILRPYQIALFGDSPGSYVPPHVLVLTGTCLVIVGAIAHASLSMRRLPAVWSAVAQETLVIYVVHLLIVYGSFWNLGLIWTLGPTLSPAPMAAVVVALVASMVGLAWAWHRVKQESPARARWIAAGVAAMMALRLV